MGKEVSNLRVLLRVVIILIILSCLLFGSVVAFNWINAWVFIGITAVLSITGSFWLKKRDPRLFMDRMGYEKKNPEGYDKVILSFYALFVLILFLVPGLDAVRFKWSFVAFPFVVLGFVLLFAACFVLVSVLRANPYLSSIVEVREDKGQKLITSGPYRYVRHPWYVGIIIWFYSIPLALGSLFALGPALALTIIIIIRTVIEDRVMHREFAWVQGIRRQYQVSFATLCLVIIICL